MDQENLEKVYLECREKIDAWEHQKNKTLLHLLLIVVVFSLPAIPILLVDTIESAIPIEYSKIIISTYSFICGFLLGAHYGFNFGSFVFCYTYLRGHQKVLEVILFLAPEVPQIDPDRHKNVSLKFMRYAHLNEAEYLHRLKKEHGQIKRYRIAFLVICAVAYYFIVRFFTSDESTFTILFLDQTAHDLGYYIGLIPGYVFARYIMSIAVERIIIPAIERLRKEKLFIKLYEKQIEKAED